MNVKVAGRKGATRPGARTAGRQRDRGVALINALVVVIALAAVAAALLTRAQASRVRFETAQWSQQIGFNLDAMTALAEIALDPVGKEGAVVHSREQWAAGTPDYDIGAGRVRAEFADLQGRLNVNWLTGAEDEFVDETFRLVLAEIGLRPALAGELRDVLAPGGPRSLPQYLRRQVPIQPRGGPVRVLDELRPLTGMSPEDFAVFERHFAALPRESRLNLNTAPPPILRAMLRDLPDEVRVEFTRPDREPVGHLRELRDMTVAALETEDLEHLPLDRMTVTSAWFQADLTAELDGHRARRRLILHRELTPPERLRILHAWALRD